MQANRLPFLSFTFFLLFCGLFINQAQSPVPPQNAEQQKESFPADDPFEKSTISFRLIPSINYTWGYDIMVDNRMKIHQPCIPGLPGNEGFKTKTGAEKVARLVISKIEKGEMPPTITADELKKLNAI